MVMTLHKLAAGDGYQYYARCIAVADGDDRGRNSLDDYYSAKGEAPGRWVGDGLTAFADIAAGDIVTEAQMAALFGEGIHPNAAAITEQLRGAGVTQQWVIAEHVKLGRPFYRFSLPDRSYRQECAVALDAWNIGHGRPRGSTVPIEVREQIRTEVAQRMFAEEFGRTPANDRELSGWVARNSRSPSSAVSAFDLTFSPPKSVSTLWAIAPRPIAETIEAAHQAGVADALRYLQENAAFTRLGTNGVRQVDIEGFIAAAYTHRDSRAGDPDLHTHVVVSNKVRTLDGKKWRALDGNMLHLHNVAASEVYNSRVEAHLEDMLGVEFAERPGPVGKRAVREIVGVAPELNTLWSRRDAMITAKVDDLTAEFQRRQGREPTPKEVLRLAGTATIATRARKHAPRSLAEQRRSWQAEAVELLGEFGLAEMVATALVRRGQERERVDIAGVGEFADRVISTVSAARATWRVHHVRAEAERQLRGRVPGRQWEQVVEQVVSTALSKPWSLPRGVHETVAAPGVLARRDGTSVFVTAGSTLYTSPAVVAAEQRLIAASKQRGGRTISGAAVDAALVEYAANNRGRQLNPGQRALVRDFATSGARMQVAIAPAGTGKTTAMQVLVRAWMGEEGVVVGLAPTAAAAAVLEAETGVQAATIDKFVDIAGRLASGLLEEQDAPEWVRGIDSRALLVIDEAAKASTRNLDLAVRFALARGASVRALGDDRQLAAVAAGGVIRDIAHVSGALGLSQVMRFADAGERAASLALREGDPGALGFYADRGRIHVGTLGSVTDQAFRAWAADVDAGRDSILLAPTRDLVAELNVRARSHRLERVDAPEKEVVLGDGLAASVGDLIATRRNDYGLRISSTDHVRNGYRWRIRTIHDDGRVTAAHTLSGRLVTLPAAYVAEHTGLGYAATIDTSQGLTVDTCHGVLTGRAHRAQLYVMMTRGRTANHAYVETALDSAEPAPVTLEAARPPTYLDVLTDVLGRDGGQESATGADRSARDPRNRLRTAAPAFADAVALVAEELLEADFQTRIDAAAARLVPGLTDEATYPTLRQRLALVAMHGGDPVSVLEAAVAQRELDSALDRAAVLSWRISPEITGEPPVPWLPAAPQVLLSDTVYGGALREHESRVGALAAAVESQAREWTAVTAPMWARPLLGSDPQLLGELAVWRAAHGIADNDRRRTGAPVHDVAERRVQQDLERRAVRVLGDRDRDARRWSAVAVDAEEKMVEDPYWPVLAEEFSRAAAAGVDVPAAVSSAISAGDPLPAEQPAAALRWRMSAVLDERAEDEAEAFARVLDELRGDPLRRMSDTELDDEISSLSNMLLVDQTMPALLGGDGTGKRADAVRARHQRLDEQAGPIRIAQRRRSEEEKLARAHAQLKRQIGDMQRERSELAWWQVRARGEFTRKIAEVEEQGEQLAEKYAAARQAAESARQETDAPVDRWAQIVADADDVDGRRQALEKAEAADQREERERARALAKAAETNGQFEEALGERRRRDQLSDPESEREDRARDELSLLKLEPKQDPETGFRRGVAQPGRSRGRRTRRGWGPRLGRDSGSSSPSFGSGPSAGTGYGL
ncbi:MobF family relaxase [Nocardia testacea]|uniref:MobF family relaxase n=1 Tax=Nocardia testacea TaxID=248551 RepID=UPI00340BADEF